MRIESFKSADIERLTNGRISAKMLNHWSSRSEWLAPPLAPGQGRARTFSRTNVIEAVLVSEMTRVGMDRGTVRSMMHIRALGHWLGIEHAGRLTDAQGDIGANFRDLPEFERGSRDWFWVCRFTPVTNQISSEPQAVQGAEQLTELLAEDADPVSTVINISSIVRRVDKELG